MTCEIPIEHRSEQERACAFKRQLIEANGDLKASAEGEWARRAQPAHDACHVRRPDPLDLAPGAMIDAGRVQLEEVAQCGSPFLRRRLH